MMFRKFICRQPPPQSNVRTFLSPPKVPSCMGSNPTTHPCTLPPRPPTKAQATSNVGISHLWDHTCSMLAFFHIAQCFWGPHGSMYQFFVFYCWIVFYNMVTPQVMDIWVVSMLVLSGTTVLWQIVHASLCGHKLSVVFMGRNPAELGISLCLAL